MSDKPDPQILERLKNQPPFVDESGRVMGEKSVLEEEEKKEQEVVEEGGKEEQAIRDEEREEERAEELPPEVKERTKEQFEKLKDSNKRLNEENERLKEESEKIREEAKRLFEEGIVGKIAPNLEQIPQGGEYQPFLTNVPPPRSDYPHLTKKQIDEVMASLVDENGYVDVDLLKETLARYDEEARVAKIQAEEARRAAEEARRTAFEAKKSIDDLQRREEVKKVHEKYPELDPYSDHFNEDFYRVVELEMVDQLIKTGRQDFMAAAEKWAEKFMTKKPKEQVEKENAIANIQATTPRSSSVRADFEEHQALVEATRRGVKGALGERLKRSGY